MTHKLLPPTIPARFKMMWPILRQLRFKTIQYREYRSQDTFASWNILSPEDEVLVVWERDTTGYRTVE